MASTSLTRTFSAGNRKTYTFSAWCKFSDTTGSSTLFHANIWSATPWGLIQRQSDNTINFRDYGGSDFNIVTNRLFRDTSAWYHVVVAVDTTQATASNRVKFYINGVQETSFSLANYPTLNHDTAFNNTVQHQVGHEGGIGNYFNGSMSHIHFIDGTAYDATAFGEYDANGVWTINTSPSVTYGTNGFFILKDGNSVTDQSGNGNNFTVAGGTLTKTEDSPSNVFATLNPLDAYRTPTLLNGNLKAVSSSAAYKTSPSTIAVSSGKWWVEYKITDIGDCMFGVVDTLDYSDGNTNYPGQDTNSVGWYQNGSKYIADSNSSYGASFTTNDILGIALDLDSGTKTITFYKNGVAQPTINLPTGGNEEWYFLPMAYNGSFEVNFGNGYFGTTAVASAGTNASGIGIFEYDVPTGYTALSTKGLNL
jgi:hypothetical protein